ncbi:MAG: hypothetical protein ACLGHN_09770 [Bacteriovoracia bacterium]
MKKLVTLSLLGLSLSGFARDFEPRYYAPEFRIVNVRPMCPRTIPSGAVCMGLGSVVTVETTLEGCLDKLVYTDFEVRGGYRGVVEIHAVGLAKWDPKSLSARCIRANTIRKTVNVDAFGEIKIINQKIEQ